MAVDKFHLNTVMLVQARMGSTRLPGKTMKAILGRPLLSFLIERLQRSNYQDEIVVATSSSPLDKQIVDFCRREHIEYYIGNEEDVLDRYFHAAQVFGADVVVRVTADCPLIDPVVVDEVIQYFIDNYPKYDYVSNVIERTFPRGMDVEVFSIQCLETLKKYAGTPEEKEHVTLYVLNHKDRFSTYSIVNDRDLSANRWTVDTPEDFHLIQKILEGLYPVNSQFAMKDILDILNKNPDWGKINEQIKQKKTTYKI